jgi:hypothetical protein
MDESKRLKLVDIKKYLLQHGWVLSDGLFQDEFPIFTKYLTVDGIQTESSLYIETRRTTVINYDTGKPVEMPESIRKDVVIVKAMLDDKQKHLWGD